MQTTDPIRVYVPGSFDDAQRNELIASLNAAGAVVTGLPEIEVRAPWHGMDGLVSGAGLIAALERPEVRVAADQEIEAAVECDVCVLLMPAGLEALLGAGLASGYGARLVVVLPEDVMGVSMVTLRAADDLVTTIEAAVDVVRGHQRPEPAGGVIRFAVYCGGARNQVRAFVEGVPELFAVATDEPTALAQLVMDYPASFGIRAIDWDLAAAHS